MIDNSRSDIEVAYHEAGHACAFIEYDFKFGWVTIDSEVITLREEQFLAYGRVKGMAGERRRRRDEENHRQMRLFVAK